MREKENIYGRVFGICFHLLLDLAFIYFLIQGYMVSYHFSYALFGDLPKSAMAATNTPVVISQGSTAKDVSVQLEECGVVENRYLFLARAYIGKYKDKIVAGSYELNPGMTPDNICKMICGMQSEDAS